MNIQIGKVTHYFDKLGVAIIEVTNQAIKTGDKVKFSGHDQEFDQVVSSLQIEHVQVEKINKGQSGGMKVDQPVKEGDKVYLL